MSIQRVIIATWCYNRGLFIVGTIGHTWISIAISCICIRGVGWGYTNGGITQTQTVKKRRLYIETIAERHAVVL